MNKNGLHFILILFGLFLVVDKSLAQSTPEITALIDSTEKYYITDGDKTIQFARQALSLAENADDYWGKLNANQMIGEGQYTLGNLDSSLFYHTVAMELAKKEGDQRQVGNSFISRATIATTSGKHDEAITYYQEGIKIKEALKDSASLCSVFLRLGNVYSQLGKHTDAAQNYLTGIRICDAIQN
ncbi:MAG: tetratricopeptide repeat protein, partial [Saprospiraceae bacterium]|nr:tetratricopeptide repeat protein [Saprospiraceae bacterium]